jgi:hypothetical protein
MNPERLEALLWERIDGTISDDDLAEIEAALAEHPGPGLLEREIAHMAEGLENLHRVSPPGELRARIDNALSHAGRPGVAAEVSAAVVNHQWAARPQRWLPLAACVLIGVGVGYLLPTSGGDAIDESRVVGTIGANAPPHGPPLMIDLDGELGSVIVSCGGTSTTVDLNLTTEAEVTLTLEQSGEVLEIRALDDTGGAPTTVSIAGGAVVLHTSGPGGPRLGVTTGEGPAPLRIVVTADGTVVAERWISLPEAGDRS